MKCRHCHTSLEHVFLDLGFAPPSNDYLSAADLNAPEQYFPLKVFICSQCWLVQTADYAKADELFRHDYAYFSSVSSSWLAHAHKYVDNIIPRLGLDKNSHVIEIASNDGYLLKNFVAAGISCLGIEPTESTASAAESLGIPVLKEFFGEKMAQGLQPADLIIGNNVYAHVPDINDFTKGMKTALKEEGTITLEFPHLMELMQHNQFDTIYHEHYSYLSLHAVSNIFTKAGLRIFDVETLSTHGGSLRVYGCHHNDPRQTTDAVKTLLAEEITHGLCEIDTYTAFQAKADKAKNDFLAFLLQQKKDGKKVAGYGAAAKGNTLLNYAGVKADLIPFICDAAPSKQGKFTPGSHIPIVTPDVLDAKKPDYVVIFPWNIRKEVTAQLAHIRSWGGQFVTAIPEITIE